MINKYIDHTLLKADAVESEIKKLVDEAVKYNFYSVCVNGAFVKTVKNYNENIKITAVIGFPLGAMTTESKVFEAKNCVINGADEIDMVINISALKDRKYDYVENEINKIKNEIGDKILKVIIETSLLTDEEKVKACELAVKAKADFVKTSTGFSTAGATVYDVKLMKNAVKGKAKVKAAGGIHTFKEAKAMIDAGASRLGTSSSIDILNGETNG
ncbi:MAG: deoxyribose-phosphate aldolase [Peptoniphilaceae bacterium]|nr:deoxyribose-phosphate aldolase [Peptoniphilaceae bacterium]MDD7382938.1 deoxyribose-phosphate aldolase [Peptoniphilaceae bacterium]MDY3737689.1 deoxyribose-phosphate aldolase [Peptoniphilaceae bacterium]